MATETKTGSFYGTGLYGADLYGVASTSIIVDGVATTSAVGTTTVTADSLVVLTGVSAVSSLGSPTIEANSSTSTTGVSATGSTGDVTATGSTVGQPTGVAATGAVGTTQTSSIYSVTGVEASASLNGQIDRSDGFAAYGENIVAIYGIGVYGQSQYGVTSPQEVYLDGISVSATAEVGDISNVSNANVVPTGVEAEIITDSPIVIGDEVEAVGDANVTPTGVSATGAIGTGFIIRNNAVPTFSGVSATNEVGTVTISTETNIFQAEDRNTRRQVYVNQEQPRIVYIHQDKPRKVYVEAA